MPRIIQAIPNADFTLSLVTDDGQRLRFDCAPYLKRGAFQRLADVRLFRQASLAFDTVCWPGELDIAPETLLALSQPESEAQVQGWEPIGSAG